MAGARGQRPPYWEAHAVLAWADTCWPWIRGHAVLARIDLTSLATRELFDFLYVSLCREHEGGVDWPKQRAHVDGWIAQNAEQLELKAEPPDPDTWGTSPAAIAAQQRTMGMGGAVDGGD